MVSESTVGEEVYIKLKLHLDRKDEDSFLNQQQPSQRLHPRHSTIRKATASILILSYHRPSNEAECLLPARKS